MLRYVVRRLLLAVPMLLTVLLILFLLLKVAPGDPVTPFIGSFPVPDSYRAQIIEKYHLDDPVWNQFFSYSWSVMRGDLGYSYAASSEVAPLIGSRVVATLILVIAGISVGALFGILVGLISAISDRRGVGRLTNTLVLIVFATPGFWLGQILVLVFAVNLGWLPTSGFHSFGVEPGSLEYFTDSLRHLILPVVALSSIEFAAVARLMRQNTLEVASQDFIVTAALKGVPRRTIVRKHIVRNACLPVVTVIGYRFSNALAGALLVEKIFGWPGMGQLLEQSVLRRDNQTIIGIVLVIGVLVLVVNLMVDLAYSVLDPRIRRG